MFSQAWNMWTLKFTIKRGFTGIGISFKIYLTTEYYYIMTDFGNKAYLPEELLVKTNLVWYTGAQIQTWKEAGTHGTKGII